MADTPRPVFQDITVIIPTIGRDLLRGCLQSIVAGTTWPAHLIVVHQGSSPAVAEWVDCISAAGMRAERVASTQTGPAAARNRAFERVRTRFVAATDDDCQVYPDWLERLAARLRTQSEAIITGRVDVLDDGRGSGKAPSIITSDTPAVYDRPLIDRDPLFSNNMGFAIEVVERIGLMDEHPSVQYAEDAEWSYRALRAGVPIAYAPEVRVAHAAWSHASQMDATYRRYARAQGGFYGHHLRRGDRFIARRVGFELLRAPWLVLRGLVSGNTELQSMGRANLGHLVPGMIAGWRRGSP
jgi:GT2 family glycosyltransferase